MMYMIRTVRGQLFVTVQSIWSYLFRPHQYLVVVRLKIIPLGLISQLELLARRYQCAQTYIKCYHRKTDPSDSIGNLKRLLQLFKKIEDIVVDSTT